MSPADVWEKVLRFLLMNSNKKEVPFQDMTGEDIVRAVAGINIEALLDQFRPKSIDPKLTAASVKVALCLSRWFQRNYEFTVKAKKVVQDFRSQRMQLAMLPSPTTSAGLTFVSNHTKLHSNVVETLRLFGNNLNFKSFCMSAQRTVDEIQATKFDLLVLAFMGFVVVADGRFKAIAYESTDQDGLRALNRIQMWDSTVELADVGQTCLNPTTETVSKGGLDQEKADQVAMVVSRVLDGGAATLETLPDAVALEFLPISFPAT